MLDRDWRGLFDRFQLEDLVPAAVILVLGLLATQIVRAVLKRVMSGRVPDAQALLARRFAATGLIALTIAATLDQFGLELSVLFGAAGIITLALGFASQTSASNLIAGLFLIGDNTYSLGDVITVDGTTGEVVAIDLLSVKLRKFDNVLVRVPNETLIKAQVTNLTRYPIRRIQLTLRLPFDQPVELLTEALLAAADRDPLLLEAPAPVISYSGFGENGMVLDVFVWAARENFLAVKNNLQANILDEIRRRGLRLAVQELRLELSGTAEKEARDDHPGEETE